MTVTPGRGLQSSFFALLSAATVGGGGVADALGKLPAAPSTPASLALEAVAGFFRLSFSSFSFRRIWYSTIIRQVSMKKNTWGKGGRKRRDISRGNGHVVLGVGIDCQGRKVRDSRKVEGNEKGEIKKQLKEGLKGEDR